MHTGAWCVCPAGVARRGGARDGPASSKRERMSDAIRAQVRNRPARWQLDRGVRPSRQIPARHCTVGCVWVIWACECVVAFASGWVSMPDEPKAGSSASNPARASNLSTPRFESNGCHDRPDTHAPGWRRACRSAGSASWAWPCDASDAWATIVRASGADKGGGTECVSRRLRPS